MLNLGLSLLAQERKSVKIDADFAGGNIVVESQDAGFFRIHQDLRDTKGDWFYWCFRVRHAETKTLKFDFTKSNCVGPLGPAYSIDGGKTWAWLKSKGGFTNKSFSYKFGDNEGEVYFSSTMRYVQADWDFFIEKYKNNPAVKLDHITKSKGGRYVERLEVSAQKNVKFRCLITARHHACESMASFVLEGIIAGLLDESAESEWLRRNVKFLIFPFVDKDGVENGDQGKNRIPHDHDADYKNQSIYPETRAIRDCLAIWEKDSAGFALDLHNPTLKRKDLYTHAFRTLGEATKESYKLLKHLENISQASEIKFKLQDSFNFALRIVDSSLKPKVEGNIKMLESLDISNAKPDLASSIGFEIPYCMADNIELSSVNLRIFGRNIVKALYKYYSSAK